MEGTSGTPIRTEKEPNPTTDRLKRGMCVHVCVCECVCVCMCVCACISSLSSLLSSPITSPSMSSKVKPLVYSPALPPVLAKVLEEIRAKICFILKELLLDNAALLQRLQELGHLTALGSHNQLSDSIN